ncbi:MAG: hypothetical protein U9N84_02125 [Actinomycetota bacterium]|nr:hypothetical protein [Actinomycetota bacterium]
MRAFEALSGWLWVVAILGFAAGSEKPKKVKREARLESTALDRVGAYLSEAVLPVYVLHQTIIVLLAFYVVEWPLNALLKHLTICIAS